MDEVAGSKESVRPVRGKSKRGSDSTFCVGRSIAKSFRLCLTIPMVLLSLCSLRLPIALATGDILPFAAAPEKTNPNVRMELWWQVMGWGLVLILILVVSAITIIIFSRRLRGLLIRGKQPPTQADDVWAMHTVPDDLDADEPTPPSSSNDDAP